MAKPIPVINKPAPGRTPWRTQDFIALLVVIWFVICWFIGSAIGTVDLDPFFKRAWPNAIEYSKLTDSIFEARSSDGQILGYVGTGTGSAYGGPLDVAVAVNPEGKALSLAVVQHRETPTFFQKVLNAQFLGRLAGKTYKDKIILGEDVDGISRATYTVRGLTQAVHRAVRNVAQSQLNLTVPKEERRIVFGVPEAVLLGLFAVAITVRKTKQKKLTSILRWVTLLTGLVVLGFMYNGAFLIGHVTMLMIGYWPEWETHLYWYILVFGVLLFKAEAEWNLYCYDFCPFGALQEVLAKVGLAKSRPVAWPTVLLWLQRFLVIAAVSLALIFRNPGLASFEIYGTAFTLDGSSYQFILLALMVMAALFIHRPWCRYLCPIHKNTMEGLFDWCRKQVVGIWQKLRPKPAT
jgi:uncharacterized protein with FMN-binding domain